MNIAPTILSITIEAVTIQKIFTILLCFILVFMLFDFSYKLNRGEEFVGLARKHWIIIAPRLVASLSIILLLIAFVNKYYIFREALAISAALGSVYFLYFAYYWILWRADYHVITSERIVKISQPGIFERAIGEISIGDIQEVTFKRKGVFAAIFKYGTVRIMLSGGRSVEMEHIYLPEKIYQAIIKLKEISGNN